MKKMLIVAAVAAACASQAATIRWGTGTVKLPTNVNMAASNSTLYFWAESISDPWTAQTTVAGEGEAAIYTVAASAGTQSYRSGSATITGNGTSSTYSSGDTALATVIITYDATGDGKIGVGDYYMIGTGSYTLDSDVSRTQSLAMGSWTQIQAKTTPVDPGDGPEPTSGLLLAVGGAMLALRRKRA